MNYADAADELLQEYKAGLIEQLRQAAWNGLVDRFADIMRIFWDENFDVSIAEIENVTLYAN